MHCKNRSNRQDPHHLPDLSTVVSTYACQPVLSIQHNQMNHFKHIVNIVISTFIEIVWNGAMLSKSSPTWRTWLVIPWLLWFRPRYLGFAGRVALSLNSLFVAEVSQRLINILHLQCFCISAYQQQLDFLLNRKAAFKEAALAAKKKEDKETAMDLLKKMKGFDPMIEQARNGLKVRSYLSIFFLWLIPDPLLWGWPMTFWGSTVYTTSICRDCPVPFDCKLMKLRSFVRWKQELICFVVTGHLCQVLTRYPFSDWHHESSDASDDPRWRSKRS